MSDGRLVHFSFMPTTNGDKYLFGVEVFDSSGKLLGYGPAKNYKPFKDDQQHNVFALWKDRNDRFYLADHSNGFSVIRRTQLVYALNGN